MGVKLTTHLHLMPRSKDEWSYTSIPQCTFMAGYLVKHSDNFTFTLPFYVTWVSCYHSMGRSQVADGGDGLQMWRVAVNISNKKWQTDEKGWSSSLGVGRGANNSSL